MENYLKPWRSWKGCKSTIYPTRLEKRFIAFTRFCYYKNASNKYYKKEGSTTFKYINFTHEDYLLCFFIHTIDINVLRERREFCLTLKARCRQYGIL